MIPDYERREITLHGSGQAKRLLKALEAKEAEMVMFMNDKRDEWKRLKVAAHEAEADRDWLIERLFDSHVCPPMLNLPCPLGKPDCQPCWLKAAKEARWKV